MKSALPWIACLLALVACLLSAFLWWSSATTEQVVGCNAFSGFDCQAALGSRWAKWFGVPVAAGGMLAYISALAGALLARMTGGASTIGWRLLELAVPLVVGAGVWFTIVQVAFLESLCIYCLATHLCGLAMAVVVGVWRYGTVSEEPTAMAVGLSFDGVTSPGPSGPPPMGIPTLVGTLGVIGLVVGQTVFSPPAVAEFEADLDETFQFEQPETVATSNQDTTPDAESAEKVVAAKPTGPPPRKRNGSRQVSLLNGQLQIDTYGHAILGSPEAPYIVVEMMDYACKHCREFHDKLTEALDRFEGQVAVVVMPVPGEISCNPYVTKARKGSAGACYAAKLSIAVSRLDPDRFESFHHWMLQAERIPSRTASLIAARERVDGDDLSDALRDAEGVLASRVKQYVELAGALNRQGRFGLPTQILGNRVMSGPPDSVDAVCEDWAKAFDIELPMADIPF
ncbi:MAG: vitamin K epoxide reductase family protein [Planctomycetota bacterium]